MTFFVLDPEWTPKHRCDLPEVRPGEYRGWLCECGRAYIPEIVTQHGESWRQWKRAPEHDSE